MEAGENLYNGELRNLPWLQASHLLLICHSGAWWWWWHARFTKYYWGTQNKEDEMDVACSNYGWYEKRI